MPVLEQAFAPILLDPVQFPELVHPKVLSPDVQVTEFVQLSLLEGLKLTPPLMVPNPPEIIPFGRVLSLVIKEWMFFFIVLY